MTMQTTAGVRGAIFLGCKNWILEEHGPDGFQQLLDRIPEEDRNQWLSSVMISSSFYPASMFQNLGEAVMYLWSGGKPAAFRQAAAATAIKDLSSTMKLLMRAGSLAFVAKRFPRIRKHYFSAGEFVLDDVTSHTLVARLENASVYGRAGWVGTSGWVQAALEHCGAKQFTLDHRLLEAGRTSEFRAMWK